MNNHFTGKGITTESVLIIYPLHSQHVTGSTHGCLTIKHICLTTQICGGNVQKPCSLGVGLREKRQQITEITSARN